MDNSEPQLGVVFLSRSSYANHSTCVHAHIHVHTHTPLPHLGSKNPSCLSSAGQRASHEAGLPGLCGHQLVTCKPRVGEAA